MNTRAILLLTSLAAASGCAHTTSREHLLPSLPSLAPVRTASASLGFETPVQFQEPASLDELVDLAIKLHPDIRSAHARADAARGRMIQAGLYPNPILGPNFKRLGDAPNSPSGDAGMRVIQQIVLNDKLKLARSAVEREVEAADFQALTRWFAVITQVRQAYFEYLAANYERDTLARILNVSEKAYEAAQNLEKAGAGNRPDVLRARVELEQNRLKREVSARRVEAARRFLDTSIGRPPVKLDSLHASRDELERSPPACEWNDLIESLQGSSELGEARALAAQQEKLIAKARADVVPNLTITAIPYYESITRDARAEVFVTAPIPILDRNQGNIRAAESEFARALADERTLELRLTERLTFAFQRYQAARQQVDAFRNVIVKEARASLEMIEAGYRGGDKKYDYTAVLQAQQILFQAELAQAAAMGDQWRAYVEMAGILQFADLSAGCKMRK